MDDLSQSLFEKIPRSVITGSILPYISPTKSGLENMYERDNQSWKRLVESKFNNGNTINNHYNVDWQNIYKTLDDADKKIAESKARFASISAKSVISLRILTNINKWNWLVKSNNIEEVRLAIDMDAEISYQQIITASENNLSDILRLLLENYDGELNNTIWIWKTACENGYIEVILVLLNDSRINPGANDSFPLRCAASYGNTDIIKILLKDGRVNPNDRDTHTVRYKLSDPPIDTNSSIESAYINNKRDAVEILVNDPRVRESLDMDYIKLYEQYVYENVRDMDLYIDLKHRK